MNLFVLEVCVESYYVLDAASVKMNRRDPIFDITELKTYKLRAGLTNTMPAK